VKGRGSKLTWFLLQDGEEAEGLGLVEMTKLVFFFFFFFCTLVTGPRRSLSLKLSNTRVYEPQIRARFSVQDGEEAEGLGLVEMTKLVYTEGGVGAFYQGAAERIVFWSPAVGIFLAVYCSLRQVYSKDH